MLFESCNYEEIKCLNPWSTLVPIPLHVCENWSLVPPLTGAHLLAFGPPPIFLKGSQGISQILFLLVRFSQSYCSVYQSISRMTLIHYSLLHNLLSICTLVKVSLDDEKWEIKGFSLVSMASLIWMAWVECFYCPLRRQADLVLFTFWAPAIFVHHLIEYF